MNVFLSSFIPGPIVVESVIFFKYTPFKELGFAFIIEPIIGLQLSSNFDLSKDKYDRKLEDKEKELIKQIDLFPSAISGAAGSHNPALVANYVYDLVKSFNSFYQSLPILKSAFEDKKTFRVELSKLVGITIKNALSLLGIGVVDRM